MTHRITIVGLICVLALTGPATAQEKPAAAPAAKPPVAAAEDPRDKAVNAQLDRVLPEVNVPGVGLGDVIDFLRDVTGANIYVQWKALEAVGIGKETPVTFRAKDVKFRTALTKILDSVATPKGKAQFTVDDGHILISTVPDPKHPRPAISVTGIPDKLDRTLPDINFAGQSLTDVVDFLRDVAGVNIFVDWRGLEKAGVAKNTPVAVRLKAVKLSTTLKRILDDVGDGKTPLQATFAENVLTIAAAPQEAGDAKPAAAKEKPRP